MRQPACWIPDKVGTNAPEFREASLGKAKIVRIEIDLASMRDNPHAMAISEIASQYMVYPGSADLGDVRKYQHLQRACRCKFVSRIELNDTA